jgi:hypothetical protein
MNHINTARGTYVIHEQANAFSLFKWTCESISFTLNLRVGCFKATDDESIKLLLASKVNENNHAEGTITTTQHSRDSGLCRKADPHSGTL